MAIHRQNTRIRAAVSTQTAGMEQHLLSAAVLAMAVLAVLATLAG